MFLLEDSDIVIEDVVALRYHAWLATTPIGTEIHDAYSSNGTSVNGTRGLCAPLTEGDVVTIGTSTWLSPTASWSG